MAAFFAALEVALSTISNILTVGQIALEIWLATGGWLYALRGIEFYIDCKIVNFIAYVYKYFLMILDGSMFNEALTEAILKNVYMFIGVIVFFRLLMLVVKYLINPDLVGDAKVGVNALVQRVIIGICGIIFTPTIFSLALRLQSAILEDQIIQKLIIPSDIMEAVGNTIDDGGKYIGTYVLSGFVSPAADASDSIKKEYKKALNKGDLSSIDINKGGYLGYFSDYQYEYFILISTFILAYVLWQILKYTLDLATRAFRLLLYQIMAPIAMVEYMINGSDDGVFKSWKSAVLSTYCMIFVRVMAIWFVVFVTMLMSGKFGTTYTAGSLLAKDDYLLRAIIIIALLGFMMDLPKLVGQLFGLDLEQEGNAGGILKQVGGMIKGAAIGGLAIGGAAAGGLLGGAKSLANAGNQANAATKAKMQQGGFGDLKGKDLKQAMKADRRQNRLDNANKLDHMGHLSALGSGVAMAALGSNQFTGAFANQYGSNKKAQEQTGDSMTAQESSKYKQKKMDEDRHNEIIGNQKQQIDAQKLQGVMELAAILDQSGIKVDAPTLAARIFPEMMSNSNSSIETSAKVGGIIGATAATLSASDIDSSGHVSNAEAKQKIVQEVEQVLTAQCASSGVSVDQRAIHQQAEVIVDTSNFSVNGGTVTATVTADVSGGMEKLAAQDQTITQTVNQVQGIRMNGAIEDATQTVNQTLNRIATNTEEMNVYAEITTEHVEQMRQDLSQTVNIQRNINDSLTQSVDIQRDIRTNTEETAVWTELTAETNERTANTLSNLDNGSNIPRRSDREIPNDSRRRDE